MMQPRLFRSARLLMSSLLARCLVIGLVSVSLAVAPTTVSADVTSFSGEAYVAEAMARCGPSVSGSSELATLVIDGQAITVSGSPNQTVSLPGNAGYVVINEQSSNVSGNSGSIDVNALHLVVTGIADVVIAHAHADVTCPGPPVCTGGDFLTGG